MARFEAIGFGVELSLAEIADLPDDVAEDMLMAMGEVAKRYQQAEIEALDLVDTKTLHDSIRVFHKKNRLGHYVLVHPYGKHGEYRRRLKVKAYKNSKHGRTYTLGGDVQEITNNDIGFLWEYGAPGRGVKFAAKQWMRKANEKALDEAAEAADAVYQKWLEKQGL